jgi:hypothetical protein
MDHGRQLGVRLMGPDGQTFTDDGLVLIDQEDGTDRCWNALTDGTSATWRS